MIEDEFLREAAEALGSAGTAPLPRPAVARPPAARRLNLALQGGGTHGAFTWGVLERLLEDDRLEFEAVSGTSAGAVNAAVFVQGLCEGGRDGARAAL
jgi:NTE family protein